MIRFWVGVTAAFGAGLGIGAGVWSVLREEQLKAEYKESTESFMRAIRAAQTKVEIRVDTDDFKEGVDKAEQALESLDEKLEGEQLEGGHIERAIRQNEIENYKPDTANPYHEAVAQPEPSWTYLEEEDYQDDDGRVKQQIIVMPGDDGKPVFVMDDIEINDWESRIGPSILRDFYALVPPDVLPAVLYVRNNVAQEDYEVIRQNP